jgi:hypothetical protein
MVLQANLIWLGGSLLTNEIFKLLTSKFLVIKKLDLDADFTKMPESDSGCADFTEVKRFIFEQCSPSSSTYVFPDAMKIITIF